MGFVIGAYLDSTRGTRPWGAIVGFLVGILSGALSVKRAVDEMATRARRNRR